MSDRPTSRVPIWFLNTYRTNIRMQFPVPPGIQPEMVVYSILNPTLRAITDSNDGRSLVPVAWTFKGGVRRA
jgi:hypothetical protein